MKPSKADEAVMEWANFDPKVTREAFAEIAYRFHDMYGSPDDPA